MSKKEAVLFVIILFFIISFNNIIDKKNGNIEKLRQEISILYDSHNNNNNKLTMIQEKLAIIDQSIEPKNKRWAKIKKVRDIIQEELKETGYSNTYDITYITEVSANIVDYHEEYGVKISLILSIIRNESHFNALAISPTNASGIMQIVPSTAKEIGDDVGQKYYNMFKIKDNIKFGTFYLWKMLNRFKNDEELAIRSYNCGPFYTDKVLSGIISDYPEETKNYLKRVLESKLQYEQRGL